ncbi:MAG: hypothetical protein LBU85_02900 [Treponema sp.]|jgi:hypothetical protein|nr:hypothetical protein [Treponema sp.]
MAENLDKPVGERKCKYLEIKVIQNIEHHNCSSPKMIERNKPKDGKSLSCMGSRCGCIEYE